MRFFDEIDPLTIEQSPNLVAKLPDKRRPKRTWFFLIDGNHMIIAITNYFTNLRTKESKWLHYQIEFPKKGLLWYLDTLQNKFFKTEAEGGLPKGTFHDIEEIDGERLKLGRAFNADSNGGGGYSFVTLDRKEDGFAKKITFTDEVLFNGGLIEILQDIAEKIKDGRL